MGQILLIDDDPLVATIIKNSLPASDVLLTANDGDQGIKLAKSDKPEVILLDVEMPGKNGYEVCDILKHDPATANTPVIFVSSKATLRERILGYEMGGDDYLAKPFVPEILVMKINKIREIAKEKIRLLGQIENANNTAREAISGSSELSMMVKYQQKIQNLTSHEKIVDCFFETTRQLGLISCLLLEIDHNKIFYSCTGENKPLEQEMMYMIFNQKKRFSDFGCRTQITYPNIALLIKNMPLNNAFRYGRLKDLLPIMIESTSHKLLSIETELLLLQQADDVKQTATDTQTMLQEIVISLRKNQNRGKDTINQILRKLQEKLPHMGLEEDQERFIFDTVERGIITAYDISSESDQLDLAFKKVAGIFDEIQRKQTNILSLYTTNRADSEDESSISGDVELF